MSDSDELDEGVVWGGSSPSGTRPSPSASQGFHKRKKKKKRRKEAQVKGEKRLKLARRGNKRGSRLYMVIFLQKMSSRVLILVLDSNSVLSGTQMYEHNGTTITVTTVELSREEDDDVKKVRSTMKQSDETGMKPILRVKKKPLKQAVKHKSRRKTRKPSSGKKDKRKRQNRK